MGFFSPYFTFGNLKDIAHQKGLMFGAAINSTIMTNDSTISKVTLANTDILVPEGEMIPYHTIPTQNGGTQAPNYSFTLADACESIARTNGKLFRGHLLIGPSQYNPSWLGPYITGGSAPPIQYMVDYITTIVDHFKGKCFHWNVCNELMATSADFTLFNLTNPWAAKYGGLVSTKLAYQTVRAVDPAAKLFINDFDNEFDVDWNRQRQTSLLWLLRQLLDSKIPLDGVGLQSHLWPFDINNNPQGLDPGFRKFLQTITSMGLEVVISELDITDAYWPADYGLRDVLIHDLCTEYLDICLDNPNVSMILTWGMSSRHSWLNSSTTSGTRARPDGLPTRGLPTGRAGERGGMWRGLADSLSRAKTRTVN